MISAKYRRLNILPNGFITEILGLLAASDEGRRQVANLPSILEINDGNLPRLLAVGEFADLPTALRNIEIQKIEVKFVECSTYFIYQP